MQQLKKWIRTALAIIFPQKPSAFDFVQVSPEEVLRTSPGAARVEPPLFPSRCFAVLSYKYPRTRALIWQIKYKRDAAAIATGGYILYRTLQHKFPNQKLIIVPIPVSPARRRERGYNQCELLATAILKNNPALLTVRTDILFRSLHTKRQTLKNRNERLAVTHGIFSINKKFLSDTPTQLRESDNLKCKHLVVIDDVLTTGSTLREAFTTLEKVGFTNVSGLTLAH
ncbi:MAG: phosphoribosyltransferase family protein [bacterium]